jgi:hypothetical protein
MSLWFFVMFLMMFLVVLLRDHLLCIAGFFKVRFLSLFTLQVLGNQGLNVGVDETLDLTIGVSLGTFADMRLQSSLNGINSLSLGKSDE